MSSWEKNKRLSADVSLNENLEISRIYGVSMIKRIQTSCCDFAGFKTCKTTAKMQLTHYWRQRQVRHITSMWRKRMQYMKIMLQRLVPHIKWQFLSSSKQIVRKETRQSRWYLNVLWKTLKPAKTIHFWSISPFLIVLKPWFSRRH